MTEFGVSITHITEQAMHNKVDYDLCLICYILVSNRTLRMENSQL